MQQSSFLLITTLLFYSAASALYLWSLIGTDKAISRAALWIASAGLALHATGIISAGIRLHQAPVTNLSESLTILALALVGIYLLMARKLKINALGVFVCLLAVCMMVIATSLPKGANAALIPALRSHWSSIHVISCLISYASFVLAFAAAVAYMIQERMLKRKKINVNKMPLPSLDILDRLAYRLISIGFPMLTLGVITGAMWAQSAWSHYWSWDPKETWALITWLVYAVYLHVRIIQGWRGKWGNRLLIAGFLSVAITFLGVNFLGHGLHKYNW